MYLPVPLRALNEKGLDLTLPKHSAGPKGDRDDDEPIAHLVPPPREIEREREYQREHEFSSGMEEDDDLLAALHRDQALLKEVSPSSPSPSRSP